MSLLDALTAAREESRQADYVRLVAEERDQERNRASLMGDDLDAERARREQAEAALMLWRDWFKKAQPQIDSAIALAHVHGMRYTAGPAPEDA